MAKWLDRMINWGFLAIPIVIALLVFLLSRLGCGQMPIGKMESVIERSSVIIYTPQKPYELIIQTDARNPSSEGDVVHAPSHVSGYCKAAANLKGEFSL